MSIKYTKDQESIVTLTMDLEGRSANIINMAFGEALNRSFQRLKEEKELRGVIITSAKETFLAGADIDEMFAVNDAKIFFDRAEALKSGLRWLELQGKPVVAAINGTALGAGFELALACHYRVVIDKTKTEIGLPEVSLGLLPGGGGVTRLVRLIGLQPAFLYLTEGKKVSAKEAFSDGIIHALAKDAEDMINLAREFIISNNSIKQPWDQDGYKIPGGAPTNPKVAQMLPVAPAVLAKKTHNNYPAPLAIMAAAIEGAMVDFETATRIESRYFAHLATGQVAKNMIQVFWKQLNALNAGKSRPAADEPLASGARIEAKYNFKRVGVLGAGMMGSGIAYACAINGLDVVLKDMNLSNAEKGKKYSADLLKKRIIRGKISQEKADEILEKIIPTANAADLNGCDLIIEAVFENRELKAQVTAEAEEQMDKVGVFASNTSTLPISGLAERSVRPAQFVGLHFFSPADKMPLVEIIVGKETSPETLARAFDFVKQIKKTPIVVNDGRGFYTSRVFATYVLEGISMLAEGNHPVAIERAGLQAGMPVGPLALTDEVSLSLIQHIRRQTIQDLHAEGKEIPEHRAFEVVDKMIDQFQRAGKSAGGGFYEYPKEEKKYLWPGLAEAFPHRVDLDQKTMMERMMFIQCLETVRCMEEGVVNSVADANIGSVFGWGFAPFKGGTLQYINDYGLLRFIKRSRELEVIYGNRFTAPNLLLQMEKEGREF